MANLLEELRLRQADRGGTEELFAVLRFVSLRAYLWPTQLLPKYSGPYGEVGRTLRSSLTLVAARNSYGLCSYGLGNCCHTARSEELICTSF